MFTPFAFVKQASAGAVLNPVATSWATAASITNTSVISAVSTFVDTLQSQAIWSKMVAVYPMIADTDVSSTAKTQFTYNLVNPATHTATYLTNTCSGNTQGLSFAGGGQGDTFITITPNTIGNDFSIGYYTDSPATTLDQIDLGGYDSAGADQGYVYVIGGRNKTVFGAQVEMVTSIGCSPFNQTGGQTIFTGLFGTGGSGTTGYAYRREGVIGVAGGYSNTQRGNVQKIGLGSLFENSTTALAPSSKDYQFCFMSTFLDSTEFGNLSTAVNNLQGSIDTIFSTSRKAY
jgi:hypothetical protein